MIDAADPQPLRSKRKAITTLFSYAASREGDGEHEMFDLLFQIFRTSGRRGFAWRRIEPLIDTLLSEESPISLKRAIILASPHFPWDRFTNGKRLIQLWAAATSVVPYADDIGRSVVNTLLLIAYHNFPRQHIPVGMWSWLNKRPSLPPICWGRYWGSHVYVADTVKALGDIETLKSYLLLVWSEWDYLGYGGFDGMHTSILEEFNGIGAGHHREALLRHLDHVLGQLDLGLEHLRQRKPSLDEYCIERMKFQYESLRDTLLEVDMEAMNTLTREPSRFTTNFGPLTPADLRRTPLDVFVCDSSPVSIVTCAEHLQLLPRTHNPACQSTSTGSPRNSSRFPTLSSHILNYRVVPFRHSSDNCCGCCGNLAPHNFFPFFRLHRVLLLRAS